MTSSWAVFAVCALASVYTWLNTFALDGAANVERLKSEVDFRFLAPEDVDATMERLSGQFDDRVAQIKAILNQDGTTEGAASGAVTMDAV